MVLSSPGLNCVESQSHLCTRTPASLRIPRHLGTQLNCIPACFMRSSVHKCTEDKCTHTRTHTPTPTHTHTHRPPFMGQCTVLLDSRAAFEVRQRSPSPPGLIYQYSAHHRGIAAGSTIPSSPPSFFILWAAGKGCWRTGGMALGALPQGPTPTHLFLHPGAQGGGPGCWRTGGMALGALPQGPTPPHLFLHPGAQGGGPGCWRTGGMALGALPQGPTPTHLFLHPGAQGGGPGCWRTGGTALRSLLQGLPGGPEPKGRLWPSVGG